MKTHRLTADGTGVTLQFWSGKIQNKAPKSSWQIHTFLWQFVDWRGKQLLNLKKRERERDSRVTQEHNSVSILCLRGITRIWMRSSAADDYKHANHHKKRLFTVNLAIWNICFPNLVFFLRKTIKDKAHGVICMNTVYIQMNISSWYFLRTGW